MNSSHRCFGLLLSGLCIYLIGITTIVPVFAQPAKPSYFEEVLAKRAGSEFGKDWKFEAFCPASTDVVARRVLENYGSIFVTNDQVRLPPTCVQRGEFEVLKYQKALQRKAIEIRGVRVDLQTAASTSLELAVAEADARGLPISPLDGAIAGGRSFGDTLMLWNSRFFPGLDFWIKRGRLTVEDRDEIAKLDLKKRIEKVIEWESQGIWFSTGRTRSIFTSTAPPGTSQHLALLAFDVAEYSNSEIRYIMNRHGWYQTVVDDPPHFTYLGFPESDLPSRGLIAVQKGGHRYWIPHFAPRTAPTN